MKIKFAKKIHGKPVVNAKRRITLHISQADARIGGVKSPGTCAAALAAVREVPNCTAARIHLGRAYIFNKKADQWVRYKTTEALRSEIFAFDRGGKFQPGEYDLRPLSPTDLLPKKKSNAVATGENNAISKAQKVPRKLHAALGVRRRANSAAISKMKEA